MFSLEVLQTNAHLNANCITHLNVLALRGRTAMLPTNPLGPAFRGKFVRSPTTSGPLSLSSKYALVSDEISCSVLALETATLHPTSSRT